MSAAKQELLPVEIMRNVKTWMEDITAPVRKVINHPQENYSLSQMMALPAKVNDIIKVYVLLWNYIF